MEFTTHEHNGRRLMPPAADEQPAIPPLTGNIKMRLTAQPRAIVLLHPSQHAGNVVDRCSPPLSCLPVYAVVHINNGDDD